MKAWILVPIVIVVITSVVAWLWYARCERICVAAEKKAHNLFQRGELLSVLSLIDDVDTRCNCSRYTSGDAPPLYALAQACFRQLSSDDRSEELKQFLTDARGPILKELAKRNVID